MCSSFNSKGSLNSQALSHLLFPLFGMLFPLLSTRLPYSHSLSLSSHITSLEMYFLTTPSSSLYLIYPLSISSRVLITICSDQFYTLTCLLLLWCKLLMRIITALFKLCPDLKLGAMNIWWTNSKSCSATWNSEHHPVVGWGRAWRSAGLHSPMTRIPENIGLNHLAR